MAERPMFEKVLSALPRKMLETLANEYAGIERPWAVDRKWIEAQLIAKDSRGLREELAGLMFEYLLRVRTSSTTEHASTNPELG